MIPDLQRDAQVLSDLLAARRAVTVETLPKSLQVLWTIYLTILEDAVKTLKALLQYLER